MYIMTKIQKKRKLNKKINQGLFIIFCLFLSAKTHLTFAAWKHLISLYSLHGLNYPKSIYSWSMACSHVTCHLQRSKRSASRYNRTGQRLS